MTQPIKGIVPKDSAYFDYVPDLCIDRILEFVGRAGLPRVVQTCKRLNRLGTHFPTMGELREFSRNFRLNFNSELSDLDILEIDNEIASTKNVGTLKAAKKVLESAESLFVTLVWRHGLESESLGPLPPFFEGFDHHVSYRKALHYDDLDDAECILKEMVENGWVDKAFDLVARKTTDCDREPMFSVLAKALIRKKNYVKLIEVIDYFRPNPEVFSNIFKDFGAALGAMKNVDLGMALFTGSSLCFISQSAILASMGTTLLERGDFLGALEVAKFNSYETGYAYHTGFTHSALIYDACREKLLELEDIDIAISFVQKLPIDMAISFAQKLPKDETPKALEKLGEHSVEARKFDRALQIFESMDESATKTMLLVKIVVGLCRDDQYPEALDLAMKQVDSEVRSVALMCISYTGASRGDLSTALVVAKIIPTEKYKDMTLQSLRTRFDEIKAGRFEFNLEQIFDQILKNRVGGDS